MHQESCDTFGCYEKTDKKCSLCGKSYYCSVEHQKQEWPRHKKVCKRTNIVNGYELCTQILKMNEQVDLSLTGFHLKEVVADSEKNEVQINMVKDEDGFTMIDSAESFYLEKPAEQDPAQQKPAQRAYWAMRSFGSATVIPIVLNTVLKLLYKNGYRYLVFSDPVTGLVELSLEDISLEAWSIKPTIKLTTNLSPPSENYVHITNVVDGYVIDLTAGLFWAFDREERPMILTHFGKYLAFLGERGDKMEPLDKILADETKKEHIKHHSAGLLKLIMERMGFPWAQNRPTLLKDVPPMTQKEMLQLSKDLGNPLLKEMFATHLVENDTPITRLLRQIHEKMLQEEVNVMTDV